MHGSCMQLGKAHPDRPACAECCQRGGRLARTQSPWCATRRPRGLCSVDDGRCGGREGHMPNARSRRRRRHHDPREKERGLRQADPQRADRHAAAHRSHADAGSARRHARRPDRAFRAGVARDSRPTETSPQR